jgi:hypothetical protein
VALPDAGKIGQDLLLLERSYLCAGMLDLCLSLEEEHLLTTTVVEDAAFK